MKLSEFLIGVGRSISYYPGMRKITGSTTATILFCQLFYWTGKEAAGDGWIYKTSDELTEETGLSYDEQVTARKGLIERGLIEENYARLEHKMYFRVCVDKLNAVWEIPETGNAKMGKAESRLSLNGTTEITTEITSLSEKSLQQANDKVTAIIEANKQASDKSWSKIPEPFQDFGKAFCESTGLIYSKKVSMDWISTISDWMQAGFVPIDIKKAVNECIAANMDISRPGSITWKLNALKVRKHNQPAPPPLYTEPEPEKPRITHAEWQAQLKAKAEQA